MNLHLCVCNGANSNVVVDGSLAIDRCTVGGLSGVGGEAVRVVAPVAIGSSVRHWRTYVPTLLHGCEPCIESVSAHV